MEAVLRIISNGESQGPRFHAYLVAHLMHPEIAARLRVLFLYENRSCEREYVHLAPKKRINDTQDT